MVTDRNRNMNGRHRRLMVTECKRVRDSNKTDDHRQSARQTEIVTRIVTDRVQDRQR